MIIQNASFQTAKTWVKTMFKQQFNNVVFKAAQDVRNNEILKKEIN